MKYLLPPMHTLRTFEALARLRSFARVAEELHLTPSAVSHQIKAIEAFYPAKLFLRDRRGVTLTPAGERLMGAVSVALQGISEAGQQLRSRDANRLSLTAPPSFASRWLLRRLGDYLGEHPEVDLKLHTTLALVDLDAEDIDLGIRFGRGRWPGLHSQKLFDEELFPVAAPGYAARLRLRGPADLRRCVLLRDDFEAWDAWFRRAGVAADSRSFGPMFGDSALLLQAAESGQGVALARSCLVKDAIEVGALVRIGTATAPSYGSYYLVNSTRRAESARAREFRAWLAAAVTA
ncbi:MAG TPA: transcriptional regulator GcvA [Mizugakiibacter sp.]